MTEVSKQEGIVTALLERLEQRRIPRALDIKEKVDSGEILDEYDIEFLERVMKDAEVTKRYIDERPDLQALYTRVVGLYQEITKKALENEQSAR